MRLGIDENRTHIPGVSDHHDTQSVGSSPTRENVSLSNFKKLVFSLGVSQHKICIEKKMSWIGLRSCEITMKEKKPCHTKLCAFRCLISRPQILNLRSRNQIRGNVLLSQKLRHFREREAFLTMFYTVNLSPLLVTK